MKGRTLLVGFVTGVLLTGVAAFGITEASATAPNTTYYACLKAGKLTKVGTAAPTCRTGATQISWNSVGPQGPPGPVNPTEYTWSGTVQSGGGASGLSASTFIPTGSTVSLVSGSITGDFSSCGDISFVDFEVVDGNPSPIVANWLPTSNVTGATPTTTETVTLSSSQPMEWVATCTGPGILPTFSFNVVFTVTPPPTTYS
jgi:hypothetical protein